MFSSTLLLVLINMVQVLVPRVMPLRDKIAYAYLRSVTSSGNVTISMEDRWVNRVLDYNGQTFRDERMGMCRDMEPGS